MSKLGWDKSDLIKQIRMLQNNQSSILINECFDRCIAALEAQAAKITDLEARLRLAEKRAEDAEGRDDFLMEILHMTPEELKELRELIAERKAK